MSITNFFRGWDILTHAPSVSLTFLGGGTYLSHAPSVSKYFFQRVGRPISINKKTLVGFRVPCPMSINKNFMGWEIPVPCPISIKIFFSEGGPPHQYQEKNIGGISCPMPHQYQNIFFRGWAAPSVSRRKYWWDFVYHAP